jgi:MtrB/PioB family decaheme-associated outer membrane protein
MKAQSRILATGVLLIATLPLSSGAVAQDQNTWGEYHGQFEVGGRVFIQRPPTGFGTAPAPDNWLTPRTSESRAKFEEYGAIKPGLYADTIRIWSLTKDGLYGFDFGARNVGFNNQSYYLDLSKAGQHYLTIGWDQTPHLISTSAKTIFGGVGTTSLTVDNTLQTNLQANQASATAAGAAGIAARTAIEGFINSAAGSLTLSALREKAFVDYKYTPDSNWEFKLDYSNEHRTGTRPVGMNWGTGFPTNIVEAIQPIDDRTQNINATGQYIGTSPWGKKWIANLKYSGSFYDDSLKTLGVENPFCLTSAGGCFPNLQLSLYPSNSANAFTLSNAVDLPWQSRFANTIQYNMMRQNDTFVNTAINGLTPAALPATSANAKVDTLLVNNTLTTQITKDLKSTIRYRYYDFDNKTPELLWTNYVRADSSIVTPAGGFRNLAIAYTKQNASGELNWRAFRWLTLGGVYAWEQYDRTRRDANVTNENSGKIYMDATVWASTHLRGSVLYSQRRYNNYDAATFVDAPAINQTADNLAAVRKFDMANRDRLKIETFLDVPINGNLTITPTFGLRNDRYPIDVVNQLGVSKDNGWNAGADLAARLSPNVRLMLSYNYEERRRNMADCCGGAAGGLIPANIWYSDILQRYNTFITAVDWNAIPERLDFRFEYLLALGSEANNTTFCSSGADGCTGSGTGGVNPPRTQFPAEKNSFQRFSTTARYFVDPTIVRQMGWKGEVIAKLRYIYERNHTENWAIDNMTPYIPTSDQSVDLTGGGRSIFLAYANPNYTAQIIAASLAFKW